MKPWAKQEKWRLRVCCWPPVQLTSRRSSWKVGTATIMCELVYKRWGESMAWKVGASVLGRLSEVAGNVSDNGGRDWQGPGVGGDVLSSWHQSTTCMLVIKKYSLTHVLTISANCTVACNNPPGHTFESLLDPWQCTSTVDILQVFTWNRHDSSTP